MAAKTACLTFHCARPLGLQFHTIKILFISLMEGKMHVTVF